jgi:hypothetical protein
MVAFVNPSVLTSAHCTDFSTLHGSGFGAPHGCEYIYGYYKFKTASWAVAEIETPASLRG